MKLSDQLNKKLRTDKLLNNLNQLKNKKELSPFQKNVVSSTLLQLCKKGQSNVVSPLRPHEIQNMMKIL